MSTDESAPPEGAPAPPNPPSPGAETFDLGLPGLEIDSTVAPSSTLHRRVSTSTPLAAGLPPLLVGTTEPHALTEGEKLGEGGMGVVHAAVDSLLQRTVATKRPRPEAGVRAANALIAEARTLAGLDHPNVVPVHALGQDASGAPVLVMKRVVGQRWSDLLREGRDLDRDLHILLEVADAVRFAHARGLLHRDLKLDNVMVGGFGEVYLMDWGCACRIDEGVTRELVGTPTSMAPEMLRVGAPIGPGTDIFLLGAMLQEMLTGAPRHPGQTVREVLEHAWSSKPTLWGPTVPGTLREIVDRACARAIEDRYPTVDAFAAAVRSFLTHQQAATLAGRSTAVLATLETAVAAGDPRAEILFAECRFGFRGALEGWPECVEAREGLARAYASYVPWKIRIGELDTAEALLPEVDPDTRAEWTRNLALARKAQAAAAAALHGTDLSVASNERRNMAIGVFVTALGVASLMPLLDPPRDRLTVAHILLAGLQALIFVVWTIPFRRRVFANRASRAIMTTILVLMTAQVTHRGLALWTATPLDAVLRGDLLLMAVGLVVLALSTQAAFALGAIPYVIGVVLMTLRPAVAVDVYPMALLASTAILVATFVHQARPPSPTSSSS